MGVRAPAPGLLLRHRPVEDASPRQQGPSFITHLSSHLRLPHPTTTNSRARLLRAGSNSNASTSSPAASAALLLSSQIHCTLCDTTLVASPCANSAPAFTASQPTACAVSRCLHAALHIKRAVASSRPAPFCATSSQTRPASAPLALTGRCAADHNISEAASILTEYNTGTFYSLPPCATLRQNVSKSTLAARAVEPQCSTDVSSATMVAPTTKWTVCTETGPKSESGELRLTGFALHGCQDAVTISAFSTAFTFNLLHHSYNPLHQNGRHRSVSIFGTH